jgi:hypothetical protein
MPDEPEQRVEWTPGPPGVQRLVLDGEPTPYSLTPRYGDHDAWVPWDSRPDPDGPGPPVGRSVIALPTLEGLEAWIAAAGLP